MCSVLVAIMWVNHHLLPHAAKRIDGRLLWANNFLLFSMSLIPFATAYLGQHYTDPLPAALYGAVMTLAGLGFTLLRSAIGRHLEHDREMLARMRQARTGFRWRSMPHPSPSRTPRSRVSFGIFVLIPVLYFMPESLK